MSVSFVFAVRWLGLNLNLVPVLQCLRSVDDDALARADAGEHLDLIAVLEADADRAPLDAVFLEDEHDRLAVGRPHRGLRNEYARRGRGLSTGRFVAQERH